MKLSSLSLVSCALACAALSLAGCGVEDPASSEPSDDVLETSSSALVGACTLGDGYVIPSGGHKTIYPVSCPSDCNDFPNGGLDYWLFCLNGVLGEWDPTLTGGSVGPAINPLLWNGYSRCTAKPNPYSTPQWGQSADRKTCVRL